MQCLSNLITHRKVSYEENLTLSKLNKIRKKATTSPSSANCCIVEAMRVARVISISNLEKSISLCLDERIVICLKSLQEKLSMSYLKTMMTPTNIKFQREGTKVVKKEIILIKIFLNQVAGKYF